MDAGLWAAIFLPIFAHKQQQKKKMKKKSIEARKSPMKRFLERILH